MTALSPPAPVEAPGRTGPGTLLLRVTDVREAAAGIRTVEFVPADGGSLPAHPPGSHLVLHCGDRRNAYSLTGSGIAPESYTISVLLCPDGSGGSRWVHDLVVGDVVAADGPRSAFAPVATARHHLLVAGGIGITPLLSHARAAARWNRDFTLLYGYRPGAGAHLEELRRLCGRRLEEHPDLAVFLARIETALAGAPLGTHLYACGPAALLDVVLGTAERLGWPEARVHTERFSAAALDPGAPFEVTLARSGRRLTVPSGVSLLEALEDSGVPVPSMCRQGVCGECRVPVVAGSPLHRDLFLGEAEKAAADSLMCCVSRSTGPTLELDL
ncbi:oxidoreductase [Blastococcus sp. MG754426]|uniref:PDR/VanB family oxidoreductase n=1 Tax=unclassified Blastococcus TaxID=2619396 RepID=UPI001EEFE4FA|nr:MULTISPECIES: PDR/VanB family oxidoreductase [unclassified Blastococcus]MCF6508941.1 oxidoreductase [Blastococcus sp. MG754426]MCF6512848.1 oxidoreductase [Blastococcus sp. MG754427]